MSFTAKREREYARDAGNVGTERESGLTDRQVEILKTAFLAGYFEWPRDSTTEDIADAVDISASTVQYHLRRAQKQVFGRFFGHEP